MEGTIQISIPKVGLGTWQMDNDKAYEVTLCAIRRGFRYIDCAWEYDNEEGVGKAIKQAMDEGTVRREELFIVTKLWNTFHRPALVEVAIRDSLRKLGLEYVDMYLIHWPLAFIPGDDPYPRVDGHIQYDRVPLHSTWAAMEELTKPKDGCPCLAKAIGVSNFPSILLHDLMVGASVKPAANQIESHLYLQQPNLVDWCMKNGITVMAYSPLGGSYSYGKGSELKSTDHPLSNTTVAEIAKTHECSAADVIFAWHRQRGDKYTVVTKSERPERLTRALEVLQKGFVELDDSEMVKLNKKDKNLRLNDAANVFWEIPSFE